MQKEKEQMQGFSEKYFTLLQQLQDSEDRHLAREKEIRKLKQELAAAQSSSSTAGKSL